MSIIITVNKRSKITRNIAFYWVENELLPEYYTSSVVLKIIFSVLSCVLIESLDDVGPET